MTAALMPPDWPDALCAQTSPDPWYPEDGGSRQYDIARWVCGQCARRTECLQLAMTIEGTVSAHGRHGMWGGLNPQERANLARRKGKVA